MGNIKFRAWDYKNSEMVNVIEIKWWGGATIEVENKTGKQYELDTADISQPVSFELMQYTELKDKENKDIYEGDILFWQPLSSTDVEQKGEVYYLNGSYWVKKKNNFVPRLLSDIIRYHNPIIIGNIYETPWLLED